jgi:hypothetical protein
VKEHEWIIERHEAFAFRGPSGNPAIADLAIVTRDGSVPVVVATERDDNPGVSVTNVKTSDDAAADHIRAKAKASWKKLEAALKPAELVSVDPAEVSPARCDQCGTVDAVLYDDRGPVCVDEARCLYRLGIWLRHESAAFYGYAWSE